MKYSYSNIKEHFKNFDLRKIKERIIEQNSKVIWLTGLSGSGKTTLAIELEKTLLKNKYVPQIIDGDYVREVLNKDLSFTESDRKENIRRIAEVSKLFIDCGIIPICCFVSPTIEIRELAKKIIGTENFIEIYINSPFNVCEKRDVKGLYKKARAGEIKNFTGIDSPFEAPLNPFLEIRTDLLSIKESTELLYSKILPVITFQK